MTAIAAGFVARRPLLSPRRANILLALLTVGLVPPLAARGMPAWFTESWALTLAVGASTVAAAISLNVLMGYAGQISLGHAAFLAVGAFTSGYLTSGAGFPLGFARIPGGQSMLVGIPAAALVGGVVALIVGFPALRLRGLYLAIVTIGFNYTMNEFVLRLPFFSTGSAGVSLPRRIFGHHQVTRTADFLAVALVVVVALWLLDDNIVRTRLGRALHAIRENEQVAQSFGVDVRRYKLIAFVTSGAMAGVAGALFGHAQLFTNNEEFDFMRSLTLVIIVMVGGLGSRRAVVIAAAAFAVAPRIFADLGVNTAYGTLIGATLLLYTVARHPGGMAEVVAERRDRRRARLTDGESAPATVPRLPALAPLVTRVPGPGPMLEVADVTVHYGGVVAVDGASLVVPRGQIVGLIGPNGAGKSTLFNAVTGLVRAEHGVVRFNGTEIQHLPAHARAALGIGRTFQAIGMAKSRTVLDNLLLAQHTLAGYGSVRAMLYSPTAARVEEELRARAEQAIATLGFERYAETPVGNLSGGQQRLVEMACVLATDPELLLLDEPSAGMAPGAVEDLALRLGDLRDQLGRTVLLIEHNIPLVLDVCDEVYVLNFGEVLAHGPAGDIAAHPEVISAYLGEAVG